MASGDNEVKMMMSVYEGSMTGFAAMHAGLSSIMNVFSGATRAFDEQFGLIDAAVTTTSVLVTQLGIDAMHAFGEFEQGMKIVQMVSGQTAQDMDFLKQKANEFSVQYRMDIDQITEGLQTLGRAGLNTASEQTEVLEAGLNTAKLEGRDLNSILQELIQNTSLLGGNLKSNDFGENSQYVNDLLVATSMTAPITTHDVSETLKYSGGIAAAAGANIETEEGKAILEDYMGAIAAFAQKGVTGSIAGTALRAFLNKPATQDSSVTDALASIHLKPEYLWEEDEETMKPISEQIALITKQMDELDVSKMDRLQIWSKIVGGKMGQQMLKLDADSIKEVTKDIQAADDAGSLAAGSMKTFEANVKQAAEQGAVLQRNVGENLVYFANPILELINTVTGFLGQDGASWPLTAGIIAAVGILAKKIYSLFTVLKTEIASILEYARAGIMMHVGRNGFVRLDDGTFVKQEEAQQSSGGGGGAVVTPTTLKQFSDQYISKAQVANPFTLEKMQKAGVSDFNMAVAGATSNLSKDTIGRGITDGQTFAAASYFNLYTQEQAALLQKLMGQGLSGRKLVSAFGKENLVNVQAAIKASEEALEMLGMSSQKTAEKEEVLITAEEERAHIDQYIAQETQAVIDAFAEEAVIHEVTKKSIEAEIIAEQELSSAAAQAGAHATALGDIVGTSTQNIAMNVKIHLTEAERDFAIFMQSISASIKNATASVNANKVPLKIVGGFPSYPTNMRDLIEHPTLSHRAIEQYHRIQRANSLREQDTAAMARYAEERYKHPYIPVQTGRTRTDAAIEAGLRANRLKNDFKEYDDAQARHYNNLVLKSAEQIRSKYIGAAGVGSVAGSLPTQKEIDESIARNEAQKQADLSHVQYLEEGVLLEQERLEIINGELIAERERASRLGHPQVGKDDYKNVAKETEKEVAKSVKAMNDNAQKQAEASAQAAKRAAESEAKQPYRDTINRVLRPQNEAEAVYTDTTNKYSSNYHPFVSSPRDTNNVLYANNPYDRQTINERHKLNREYAKAQMEEREAVNREQRIQNAKRRIRQQRQAESSQSLSERIKSRFSGTPKTFHPYTGELIPISARHDASYHPATQTGYDPYNYRPPAMFGTMFGGSPSEIAAAEEGKKTGSAFRKNFSERLNRDRMGSFFSFGSEAAVGGGVRSATKGLSGLANKALNAADMVGGTFMIAIMAVTTIIQKWQEAFQEYCDNLKEASTKLKEAYSDWNTAEDNLRQTYRNQNPDATEDDIDQMMYDTYSTMGEDMANALNNGSEEWFKKLNLETETGPEYEYNEEEDDGTLNVKEEELTEEEEHEKAIKENTGALYFATAEVNKALDNYTRQASDSWWGVDGWTGWLTDQFGGFMDKMKTGGVGAKFTDNNEFLLTQSQADENYAGNREMAGLMMENFKDAGGNWIKGMRTMMGSDVEDLAHMFGPNTREFSYLKNMAKFSAGKGVGGLTPYQNTKLQQSMMNDTKSWKKLGKELAKRDSNKKAGRNIERNQRRIEGLTKKINSTLGNGFQDTQILQAAYLQQLQDMYQVAEQAIVPIMQQNMQTAMNTLSVAGQVDSNTNQTVSTTGGTFENAGIIAGLVAIIAKAQAKEVYFDTAVGGSTTPGHITDVTGDGVGDDKDVYWINKAREEGMDANKFYAEFSRTYDEAAMSRKNLGSFGGMNPIWEWSSQGLYKDNDLLQEGALGYLRLFHATSKMEGYDYSPEAAAEASREFATYVKENGISLNDAIKTAEKNYTMSESFKQKIVDAYNMADDGDGEGSGGGGSGSGSGDKDKNQGTRKERVDLVLCNKKEIPKLNVNLFKKPPTFTVLNKNFKLRDVKINTEDKPKAIMASIKNAFIDVQKRSDPKIIQDEEAEYDPVGATDGNALPSGSSRPKTNNS